MNDNARKWVEALRSGEFEQGRQQLRTGENQYCCLGVACELYRRETGQGHWAFQGHRWSFQIAGGDSFQYLPYRVHEWLALGHTRYTRPSPSEVLTQLNDRGRTFHYIANLIESEPEGLLAAAE